jgi:hypothetical protein
MPWQPGKNFSALDAVGQFVQQEFTRDLSRLEAVILSWLAGLPTPRP